MKSEKRQDLIGIAIIFFLVIIGIIIMSYLIDHNVLVPPKSRINYLLEQEQLALETAIKLRDHFNSNRQLTPSRKRVKLFLDQLIKTHQSNILQLNQFKETLE